MTTEDSIIGCSAVSMTDSGAVGQRPTGVAPSSEIVTLGVLFAR